MPIELVVAICSFLLFFFVYIGMAALLDSACPYPKSISTICFVFFVLIGLLLIQVARLSDNLKTSENMVSIYDVDGIQACRINDVFINLSKRFGYQLKTDAVKVTIRDRQKLYWTVWKSKVIDVEEYNCDDYIKEELSLKE